MPDPGLQPGVGWKRMLGYVNAVKAGFLRGLRHRAQGLRAEKFVAVSVFESGRAAGAGVQMEEGLHRILLAWPLDLGGSPRDQPVSLSDSKIETPGATWSKRIEPWPHRNRHRSRQAKPGTYGILGRHGGYRSVP